MSAECRHFCFHSRRAILKPEDAMRAVADVSPALVHVTCYDAHKQWSDDFDAAWAAGEKQALRRLVRVGMCVMVSAVLFAPVAWWLTR